VKVDTICNLD